MKKFSLKLVCLLFVTILFLFLQLTVALSNPDSKKNFSADPVTASNTNAAAAATLKVYDSLDLDDFGLSEEAFIHAVNGYENLKNSGKLLNQRIISIADFSLPSNRKRLFIIDIEKCKLLFNTYVAHGQNTGKEYATAFSNRPESFQSSPGFYVTSGTYNGKNGYSMYLNGMEYGINHLAHQRAIVMHGADYVSEGFIRAQGYLGRSHGCPAVPEKLNKPIIEKIKNGSCFFIYSDNKNYLSKSRLLHT
ncbi:MAG: murein L,D-transpeptidase catalytic domain family protein [Sphingobacteriales bacterium]|nr:MAG: murein L,D-transpeptidase catalytic domain family protein [Sphingobacteriales bacterium]